MPGAIRWAKYNDTINLLNRQFRICNAQQSIACQNIEVLIVLVLMNGYDGR